MELNNTIFEDITWDQSSRGSVVMMYSLPRLCKIKSVKQIPIPGVEPEPPGWKPGILTARPYGRTSTLCKQEQVLGRFPGAIFEIDRLLNGLWNYLTVKNWFVNFTVESCSVCLYFTLGWYFTYVKTTRNIELFKISKYLFLEDKNIWKLIRKYCVHWKNSIFIKMGFESRHCGRKSLPPELKKWKKWKISKLVNIHMLSVKFWWT